MSARAPLLGACVVAALLAASPRPARAAPPTTDAAWQLLYDSALALLDKGEPAPACPMLEDAARYRAGAGVLIALGRCYAAAGKPLVALDRYRQALAAAPQAKQDPAGKARLAREGVARMEARIGRVAIALPADAPPGARVTRDGEPLAAGAAIEVDPGPLELVVDAPGHAPARVRLEVAAGDRLAPPLRPGPLLAAPAPAAPAAAPVTAAPAPAAPAARSRVVPAVALGVGVAGLAMMGVGGGVVLAKKGVIEAECDAQKRCTDAGLDAASSARTASAVGTAGAVIAAAGAAGFVGWLLWPAPRASTAGARVAPVVAPGYVGIGLARAF